MRLAQMGSGGWARPVKILKQYSEPDSSLLADLGDFQAAIDLVGSCGGKMAASFRRGCDRKIALPVPDEFLRRQALGRNVPSVPY